MPVDDVTIDYVVDQTYQKVLAKLRAVDEPESATEAQNIVLVGAILTLAIVIVGTTNG
jgi:hypothetical protein